MPGGQPARDTSPAHFQRGARAV